MRNDGPVTYDQGGYLSADECLIKMTDQAVLRLRCCRSGHPTPTSDCGRPDATIEPPEARD